MLILHLFVHGQRSSGSEILVLVKIFMIHLNLAAIINLLACRFETKCHTDPLRYQGGRSHHPHWPSVEALHRLFMYFDVAHKVIIIFCGGVNRVPHAVHVGDVLTGARLHGVEGLCADDAVELTRDHHVV